MSFFVKALATENKGGQVYVVFNMALLGYGHLFKYVLSKLNAQTDMHAL